MFLPNLLEVLATHDIVVASLWSIAFWYADSLEKKIMISDESELGRSHDYKKNSKIKIKPKNTIEHIQLDLQIGQVFTRIQSKSLMLSMS